MNNEFGGFWIRVVARIIDTIPILAVDYILYQLFGADVSYTEYRNNVEYEDMWTAYDGLSIIVGLIILLINYGYLTSRYGGTIGKMIFGLHVVNKNGDHLSFFKCFLRFIAYIPSSILNIGFIMVAFTPKKQGLHDILCKTYVTKGHKPMLPQ